jgi:hypothetical protein
MPKNFFLFLCFSVCVSIQPVFAQDTVDEIDGEEEMEFEEDEFDFSTQQVEQKTSPFRTTVDHSFSIDQDANLINFRSGTELEYEALWRDSYFVRLDAIANLYWAEDHVAKSANESVQTDRRIKEAWIQKSWGKLNVKLGLQTLVWSEIDGSLVTDPINPTDNRELLFMDFEDARLGQFMLVLTGFLGETTMDGFIDVLPKFNDNPPQNSIYAISVLQNFEIIQAETPDPEVGLRLKYIVADSEMHFLVARVAPNQPNYEFIFPNIKEVAEPYWWMGYNINYAMGRILWQADLSYQTNQALKNVSFATLSKDTVDIALGAEISWNNHLFNISYSLHKILDWQAELMDKQQNQLINIGWGKSYLNEDLSLNAGLGIINDVSSLFGSLLANYKIDDNFTLSSSLYLFSVTDESSDFYVFRDSHRFISKLKYQF